MIQRILTALVLIPLVLLLILRGPGWVLAIVAGIVALLAIREFLDLTRHYGVEPFSAGTYLFVGIFFVVATLLAMDSRTRTWRQTPLIILLFAAIFAAMAPFVFLSAGLRRDSLRSVYPAVSASVFALAYIALPMAMLASFCEAKGGRFYLIYLMFVVWSGDIFAYLVGKNLGRHKMAARVSPKKSWEGAAASVVASIVFGTLIYHFAGLIGRCVSGDDSAPWALSELTLWRVVLLSVVVNIAAQLGDLVESAIKRGADVKDSGSILPGHGGMLDRIDALLFAAPVLWIFVASSVLG